MDGMRSFISSVALYDQNGLLVKCGIMHPKLSIRIHLAQRQYVFQQALLTNEPLVPQNQNHLCLIKCKTNMVEVGVRG